MIADKELVTLVHETFDRYDDVPQGAMDAAGMIIARAVRDKMAGEMEKAYRAGHAAAWNDVEAEDPIDINVYAEKVDILYADYLAKLKKEGE